MAITNYGELQAAVAKWLARSNLQDRIPEFIQLTQGYLNNGSNAIGLAPLRIRPLTATVELTVVDGAADLPADFAEVDSVFIEQSGQLEFLPYSDWNSFAFTGGQGVATWYTRDGNQLRFKPVGSPAVSLTYYTLIQPFVDAVDTDWVLTNAPNVYLYGALAEAHAFAFDEQRAQLYQQRFVSALTAVQRSQSDADQAGGAMVMRPRSVA